MKTKTRIKIKRPARSKPAPIKFLRQVVLCGRCLAIGVAGQHFAEMMREIFGKMLCGNCWRFSAAMREGFTSEINNKMAEVKQSAK